MNRNKLPVVRAGGDRFRNAPARRHVQGVLLQMPKAEHPLPLPNENTDAPARALPAIHH